MLAVGDSVGLEILFSTKSYRSELTKRIRITTNEGPPDIYVSIHSVVTPIPDTTSPLLISPAKLDISQFSEVVRDEVEFQVTNLSDESIKITVITRPDVVGAIYLPGSIRPGQTITGRIELSQEGIESEFEKSITIECDDADRTRFTIPIRRVIRSGY